MSKFLNIFLSIILLTIWIISGGFITQANVFIQYHRDDDYLKKAYTYSFVAAFITWFIIAVFILVIILASFGVIGAIGSIGKKGTTLVLFLIISFLLTFLTGILSVLTAVYLQTSNDKNKTFSITRLHQAYIDSIISSCMCLASTILLVIAFFLYEYLKHHKKGKESSEEESDKTLEEAKKFSRIENILQEKK